MEPTYVTYHSIISAYHKAGSTAKAEDFFRQMQAAGVKADFIYADGKLEYSDNLTKRSDPDRPRRSHLRRENEWDQLKNQ